MTETEVDTMQQIEVATVEASGAISEALALIDRGLGDMMHRELVSTDEVADLLLDVRLLLTADLAEAPSAN
ncbi:hypothetical protein [Rhabdothermincola sp.]|uniref:hypothetical protein n=1 Tax=Rhabdothermincola sp. TaxID=2820405 RepID=UPI002FE406C5